MRKTLQSIPLSQGSFLRTSSLGSWQSVVITELMRPRATILIICTHGVTALCEKTRLNALIAFLEPGDA
jgi:thiamine phosphate synthase YjbQ (UPF0047 family)